jgi:cytochrome d ubiquinol oxidase subunit II
MGLILSWAAILSAIIIAYIILDGFDLGIGILFPWVKGKESRDIMMSTIVPVWDGNETFLIFGAAALYGAFPVAYGILFPMLYMPIMIMVSALVLRGVSFEFRFKDVSHQPIWDVAFSFGSIVAAFMQGMILGRFVQGFGSTLPTVPHAYNWITPFSMLTGVMVVIGYALLGSNWLIMRTSGALQTQCFKIAQRLLIATGFCLGIVCLWTLFLEAEILQRWMLYRHILWVIPITTAFMFVYEFYLLRQRHEVLPFFLTIGVFILSYIGFGTSLWPYAIPHALTFWEAAAPASSLKFSIVGAAVTLPILFIYTSYTYYVFRGKVTQSLHY